MDCDAIQTVDLKINARMEQIGKSGETTHYALLFPEGTLLDNRAFSGDAQGTIEKHLAPLNHDATDNDVDMDLYGMVVYWRITEKFSGQRIKPKAKKFDMKAMFSP